MSREKKRSSTATPRFRYVSITDRSDQKLVLENEQLNRQVDSCTEQVVQYNTYRAKEDLIVEAIFQKKELSASVENKIADLEKEEPCKNRHNTLLTSQAACLFEWGICSYVLPKVYEKGKFASIPQLQEYLSDDSKKLPKESVSDSILRMIWKQY